MKRKRWVLLLALVFSLQVILAACSGNNNSGGSGESQQPSNGGQSPSGDVVEIVMWHMEEPPNRVQRFQEIADAFNAANPDIRVIPQVQSWGDAYTRFPAAIQAGRGPDLLFTIPDYTTLINSLGVTQPVDDIVADLDAKHKFLEAALTPYQYDGHTWAVPLYGMVQVLWYRKDILDEAGIEPPKNWDDLKAAVETLTTKDRYGIALPASRSLATDQVIYTFMITSGAKDIIDENNNVTFNNEKPCGRIRCMPICSNFRRRTATPINGANRRRNSMPARPPWPSKKANISRCLRKNPEDRPAISASSRCR